MDHVRRIDAAIDAALNAASPALLRTASSEADRARYVVVQDVSLLEHLEADASLCTTSVVLRTHGGAFSAPVTSELSAEEAEAAADALRAHVQFARVDCVDSVCAGLAKCGLPLRVADALVAAVRAALALAVPRGGCARRPCLPLPCVDVDGRLHLVLPDTLCAEGAAGVMEHAVRWARRQQVEFDQNAAVAADAAYDRPVFEAAAVSGSTQSWGPLTPRSVQIDDDVAKLSRSEDCTHMALIGWDATPAADILKAMRKAQAQQYAVAIDVRGAAPSWQAHGVDFALDEGADVLVLPLPTDAPELWNQWLRASESALAVTELIPRGAAAAANIV